jgi:hypothetical protein
MVLAGQAHYCSCGTRLARDNHTGRCGACRKKDRERFQRPPLLDATFWDHPEICAAFVSRHFGRVLRAYRCHPTHGLRPLAQDVVARWLGLTQPQLSRIENGSSIRDLDRLTAWALLLAIPEHLLWFRLPPDSSPEAVYASASSAPGGAPAAQPPSCVPQELAAVGTDDLAALQSLRTADRQVGGGYLYTTVANYLQHTVAPRLFGGTVDGAQHSVFTVAAGLTEMAGWMAHDAGRDALAEQHFLRALSMAQAGRDHQVGAHVLGSLSHLAHHAKQPKRALAYARRGHERLAVGRPHPKVEARLLAMQARAHATEGEQEHCIQRLRQAERALATAPGEALSPWVSPFDEASLAMEAARCFWELGHFGEARRQSEQVVGLRPRERPRSRAFAQLMLISILVVERKPDEACDVAYEVLDATRALSSYLVVQQLEELDQALVPYAGDRDVSAFREYLQHELRERRWLSQSLAPKETGAVTTGTT